MKKILSGNTAFSLFSNGLTAILGFLNLGLIARLLSKEDAGKWFILLTVYTVLELLRSGWVQTPFVRYYVVAKSKLQRSKLTAAAWQLLLLFTLILAVVALPIMYFGKGEDIAFTLARRFTVIWLIAALPYQLLQWQLQANRSFKKLAFVRLIFPVAFAAALCVQSRLHFGVETLALLYAALQFLAGIIGIVLGWLKIGRWFTNLSRERAALSGYGKYSMVTMVAASLLRASDQFIIAMWLGPAAVAVYSIPQKLIEAIEIPVRSFTSLAIPEAITLWHEDKLADLRTFFYRQCGFLMALVLPMLLILFLMPAQVVNLLGGGKYQQSAMLLQIFCLYAAVIPLDRYCGLMLDAGNRPKQNTLKVLGMLLTNVLLDMLALKLGFGLYGVAAVSLVTFMSGTVIGWLQLRDVLGAFALRVFWHEGILRSFRSVKSSLLPL